MKEYLALFVSFLIGVTAHHEVHLVPAHKICPDVNGNHDILLPDPRDCSVYYRCENGTAIPQSCPPGLAWCQILQNCTLPILANCTLSHTIVTYSPEELVTYNPYPSTENPVTGPTTSSETCPKDGVTLPSPEDCRKYYKCKKGKPHPEHCSGKQRYSTWLGICTAPEIANCINVGTQKNKTCPVNGAKNVYPADCSKYYECVGNTVEIKQCPSGEEYNEWFKDCYSSDLAYCHRYSTVSPTTLPTTIQTPGPDNTCPGSGYKLPNPLNCTTYFLCENNNPTLQNCPAGFEYSCWEQECLPPSDSQCLATQEQSCKNSGEKLPNSQDCHSYFECRNGITEKKDCKIGLEYNAWFKQCVHSNVAHCKVELTTTPTTPTNSPHTPSPGPNDICPIDGAKLPDPLDCHSYYICDNEIPVQKKCPQDLAYSCWNQECLPAESADCINNINQTGDSCKTENTTMPNINDCSTYYRCENGKVVLKNCENGLEFNAWFGKCVVSSLSHCKRITTENPTGGPTEGSSETFEPTEGSSEPTGGSAETTGSTGGSSETTGPSGGSSETAEPTGGPTGGSAETTEPTEGSSETSEPTSGPTGGSAETTGPTGESSETSGPTGGPTGGSAETTGSTGGSSETTGPSGGSSETAGPTGGPTGGSAETTEPTEGSSETSEPTSGPTGGSVETTGPTGESSETSGPTGGPTGGSAETTGSTGGSSETTGSTGGSSETTGQSGGSSETAGPTGGSAETTEPTEGSSETSEPTSGPTGGSAETTGPTGESSETSGPTGGPTGGSAETTGSTGGSSETTGSTKGSSETTGPSGGSSETAGPTGGPTGGSTETTETTEGSSETSELTSGPTGGSAETTGSTGESSETSEPTGGPTGGSAETTGPTGDSSETSGPTSGPTDSSIETTPSASSNPLCPVPNILYPSYTECNAYMKCNSHLQLETITCNPPTFNYNCESKTCENITHCCAPGANTTTSPTTSTTTPTPSPIDDVCPSDGAKLPNPIDCTSYFVCRNNTPVSEQCPPGQEYSCWDQQCQDPKDAVCIDYSQPGKPCSQNNEKLPNIGDCGSYYQCVKGIIELRKCDSGKLFNKWFKKCVPYAISHCEVYPTSPGSGTPTTISPSPTQNVCPFEGAQLPNPLNCSTYFVCLNNEPSLKSCPAGQAYSCWDQQCQSSAVAHCITDSHPGDSCSINNLPLPNIEDCRSYYICQNGSIVSKKCPANTQFNSWFQKCVKTQYAHCQSSTTSSSTPTTITTPKTTTSPSVSDDICPIDGAKLPNPLDCSSYFICINETAQKQQCPSGQEYSCWDQKCEKPENSTCIKEGSQEGQQCSIDGNQQQNVEDCGSYYECVHGKIKLKQCSKGKFYNKWFKKCLQFQYAHCKTSPTIKPPYPTLAPPTTVSPSTTEDICPFEGALLPNPLNCSTYFTCINNEPTLQSCPSGQGYSCWDQQCESGALDKCNPNSVEGQSCSIEGIILPNSGDCESYLECINGTIVNKSCEAGTGYNSWFRKCVESQYSHCQSQSTTNSTDITTTKHPDTCPLNGAILPNPLDCNSYFTCENEEIVSKHCPAGEIYSCWDQKCESPENATCINEGNQQGHHCSIEVTLLPKIDNCSSYYECNSGKIEVKICTSGKMYSKWHKTCVPISAEICITYSTQPPITTPSGPTDPTDPTEENDVCPLEGVLIPNPIDCATYYKCINGTPILEKCPDGNKYSCWDQQCEPDTDATCVSEGGQNAQNCTVEGLCVTDVTNCNNYYECQNGTIILKHCPSGQEFNANFQKCYKPKLAHCQKYTTITPEPVTESTPQTPTVSPNDVCPVDGVLLPNPLNCSAYYKCINGTPTPELCAVGYEYSCWNQICEPAGVAQCITGGIKNNSSCKYKGQKLQNPDDCHSYYECVNGTVNSRKCASNWYYNKWFHICVPLAILAHCQPTTITIPPSTLSTTTQRPSSSNDLCPKDGALLPNPLDCSGYYKCENSKPIPQKCPSGQEYSCWDQKCETASDSQCINAGVQLGQNCSRDGVRLQDLESCSSYYECQNGKVEKQYCSIGLQYNRWYQKCVFILYAHCKIEPINTTTTTTPAPQTPSVDYDVCPIDGALLPNPVDCTTYYQCVNNTPTLQSCPDGQEYSCWDLKCELNTESVCIASGSHSDVNCSVDGLRLHNLEDCGSFYECDNAKTKLKHCPPGQEFNDRFQDCHTPKLAHCQTYSTLPTSTEASTSTCTPSVGNDLCPVNGTLIPNPLNCSTYFKCINQTPILQLCADGYEYSCWDQMCEPIGEAQCISEGSQSGKACKKNGNKNQDPTNCHGYLECVNNVIVHKQCPLNMWYNKWFKYCVPLKILAHCDEVTTHAPLTTKVTTVKPTGKADECPNEGAVIPDPTDCSKYLKCIKNKQTSQTCPKGQKYSAWDQQCKKESEVICLQDGSDPQGKSCPRDGVKLQNLQSCTSYYECYNGIVQKYYCFVAFQYNRWYQSCEFSIFPSCVIYSTHSPPKATSTPSTVTDGSLTSTVRYPNAECPENGVKVPNIRNCNQYYSCNEKHPVLHNCPTGQNFDPWSDTCVPISQARCVNNPQAWEGDICTEKKETVPDVTSCDRYYICKGKKIKKVRKCPAHKQYSIWQGKCEPKDRAICAANIV